MKSSSSGDQNITFHLILSDAAAEEAFFPCICKWQRLFTETDDLAGACQKLLLLGKKIHSVRIIVSQKTVFLMVKYKSLISVCAFTTDLSLHLCLGFLSCCERSLCGALVQVIGFPRKTSESVVYQLSGTGFQGWNAGSVQRLLGEVNAHLFF